MSDIPDEIMERAKAAHAQFADSRVKDNLTVIIYRAIMAERKKTLEEAAKVADAIAAQEARMSISYFEDNDRRSASLKSTAAFTAQEIATAIRKLGETK